MAEPPADKSLQRELEALGARIRELEAGGAMFREGGLFRFLDDMPIAVFVLNAAGVPVYANTAAQEILGRGVAPEAGPDQLAQTYSAYIAGTDTPYPADRMPVVRALAGEHTMAEDMEVRHPDRSIPVQVWAGPLYDSDRKLMYALAAFVDITDRRRAEAAVAEAHDTAVRAAKLRGDFIAMMSHEVRTPINAILGMANLLREGTLAPEQRTYVETIRLSAETLLSIVNDVLDFSRVEAKGMTLEERPVDLYTCLEEVVDLVSGLAPEKRVDIVYSIDSSVPPFVLGDVTRLRQVLLNLAGNAVKFTASGEVVLSVRCSHPPEGDARLVFSVRDTGSGIPPERLPDLFEPYTQAEVSTARTHGGSGLGLAICQRLVGLMGGTISVESTQGVGSTFSFAIACRKAEGTPAPYLGEHFASFTGRRILLVDDNEACRSVCQSVLRRWGFEVEAVAEAPEALARAREGDRFDLALLDLEIGPSSGLELGRQLREESGSLSLVLLAPPGRREATGEAVAELFLGMVGKPIKMSELFEALTRQFAPGSGRETTTGSLRRIDRTLGRRLPLKILVAEDHPANQKFLVTILQHMGYAPDVAGDGTEVLLALGERAYDLIFMDVEMPGLDGYETTKQIMAGHVEGPPVVIGTTGHASAAEQERCRAAGMRDVVAKPIRIEQLQNALERWGRHRLGLPPLPELQPGTAIDSRRVTEILRMGGRAGATILARLLESFSTEMPGALKVLEAAAEAGQYDALAREAHRLKGAAANLGALGMVQLCRALERSSRARNAAQAREFLGELTTLEATVMAEISDLKARLQLPSV
jgi:signal transduction histidine kinase/DNA-binding response OmpR family regulator/HPt (histidine-containing phosphotransfer) domain-containing protein